MMDEYPKREETNLGMRIIDKKIDVLRFEDAVADNETDLQKKTINKMFTKRIYHKKV